MYQTVWFEKERVTEETVHLIGMYKTPRTKFDYSDQKLTHSQILNMPGQEKCSLTENGNVKISAKL